MPLPFKLSRKQEPEALRAGAKRPFRAVNRIDWSGMFGFDLFISYKRSEAAGFAAALAQLLLDRDYRCFLDRTDAPPGMHLGEHIRTALGKSRVLLVIVTPGAIASPWVTEELEQFRSHGKRPVIPIDVDRLFAVMEPVETPWGRFRKLNPIWLEANSADVELAQPDKELVEGIDGLFKHTKANALRRTVTAAAGCILVAASLFAGWKAVQERTARVAAETSEQREKLARKAADDQKVFAVAERKKAVLAVIDANSQRAIAVQQKARAEERTLLAIKRQRESQAREFAAASVESFAEDGERSIILAMHAVNATLQYGQPVVPSAEAALHRAVLASRLRLTLRGHSSEVLGVAFSPDGKAVGTASKDNTAKIWDSYTGRDLFTLRGHKADVKSIVFSPDGQRIATASADGTAKLWDAATGGELVTIPKHSGGLNAVTFSGDGTLLATAGDDSNARIIDAHTGKELRALRHGRDVDHPGVFEVAFSPDGKLLATSSSLFNAGTTLWDVGSGKQLRTLNHGTAVAFSPDGKRLATVDGNKGKVWDLNTGVELLTIRGEVSSAYSVAFSPDGSRLATSNLWNATVWDAASGLELFVLPSHSHFVAHLAFSPDGRRLATASWDHTAKIWDLTNGQELVTLRCKSCYIEDAAFSPDGKSLAATVNYTAKIWAADNGRELLTLSGHTADLTSVRFSSDGKLIATGARDGMAKLWDAFNGNLLITVAAGNAVLHDGIRVAFSGDNKRLITASEQGFMKAWDVANGAELPLPIRGRLTIKNVAFSSDGKRLAISDGNVATILETRNWHELIHLSGHSNAVVSAVFSPDGKRVATASRDWTARTWDGLTGQPLATLRGHRNSLNAVAFSPDGTRIATASDDDTARLWNADTGQELFTLKGHSGYVFTAVFSPDGKRLATASGDGTLQVYALDVRDLLALAQTRLTRAMTVDECKRYRIEESCPAASPTDKTKFP